MEGWRFPAAGQGDAPAILAVGSDRAATRKQKDHRWRACPRRRRVNRRCLGGQAALGVWICCLPMETTGTAGTLTLVGRSAAHFRLAADNVRQRHQRGSTHRAGIDSSIQGDCWGQSGMCPAIFPHPFRQNSATWRLETGRMYSVVPGVEAQQTDQGKAIEDRSPFPGHVGALPSV